MIEMTVPARTSARRRALAGACGCALAAWLSACAASKKPAPAEPSVPEIDVLQLKENSDEALKIAHENKLELQEMNAKLRELEARLNRLGEDMAKAPPGKLEELQQRLDLLAGRIKAMEDSGDGEAAAAKPPAKDSAARAQGGRAPGAKAAPKGGASEPELEAYRRGTEAYYSRNYPQAIAHFEDCLRRFPKGAYADNCTYWIGECWFAQGDFQRAIAQFRKVFAFPGSQKADDAQLKLGYCYLRLGDRKRAAEEFRKVVSLYPESEYTERAKEELSKLE